ncbi:MAG TPA: HepT-like ribonuclease domain-containing protein [Longimicrobiaceae bacterium]|nr:HepT-like ribonuclease domain-containing protein [Longimicrobiaceae bacterium]
MWTSLRSRRSGRSFGRTCCGTRGRFEGGVSGFRNMLVHDYLGIDLDRVWAIIEQDMPALKHAAESLASELP